MNKEELNTKVSNFVESKNFKIAIYILGTIFVLSFIFQAGMMAGYRKASFSRNWGDNYEKNFGPGPRSSHRGGMFIEENFKGMPNANGAIGKIIKVELPNIIVLDKDQTEKVVVINDDTSILERKEKVTKDILTLDKFIVVIGVPNESGQIEAKLIRILPIPEEMIKGIMFETSKELPEISENKKI